MFYKYTCYHYKICITIKNINLKIQIYPFKIAFQIKQKCKNIIREDTLNKKILYHQ